MFTLFFTLINYVRFTFPSRYGLGAQKRKDWFKPYEVYSGNTARSRSNTENYGNQVDTLTYVFKVFSSFGMEHV